MGITRLAGILVVGLMACGPKVVPTAQISPAPSPTPAQTSQPESAPTPGVASVTCSGGPGTAMVVIARAFVYDVADPLHPRLACRGANTVIHLLERNAIAYTTVVAGQVFIVRHDLTTGSESRIGQLRADPKEGTTVWTSDGSLEVYPTAVPRANSRWLEQIHLWSNGSDHILYEFEAGPGGFAGRWSAHFVLEFSPDQKFIAISDTNYSPQNYEVRIFSVVDLQQKLSAGTQGLAAAGGTWVANDRFVWAAGSGALMQWTPAGGAKVLRSERWFTPTSSSDGRWLAGTLLTDDANPRTLIVPVAGGGNFTTAPGSSPGFVTPTVVWYAGEGPDTSGTYQCLEPCAHPTVPDGTVRAFDVASGSDRLISFRAGEAPKNPEGYTICCLTGG